VRKIDAIIAAGIDWVQIREKDLTARELAELTRDGLRVSATHTAARIIVNDRLDVALAEGAAGVHLGKNSLPVNEAARLVKTRRATQGEFLLGVSCHSLQAAKSAAAEGASYLVFGPVFATPSKAAFGAPQGVARLAEVCRAIKISVLAIGGITLENAAECFTAGAAGIAAIRLFQDASDPATVIRSLRECSNSL
jgi:thiamine-phosphate pyrophosphorylase